MADVRQSGAIASGVTPLGSERGLDNLLLFAVPTAAFLQFVFSFVLDDILWRSVLGGAGAVDPALFLICTSLCPIVVWHFRHRLAAILVRLPAPSFSWMIGVLALGTGMGALLVGATALHGFINSADEATYLFQADTMSQGRLWNAIPPLGEAMANCWTWIIGDKWVGQYPPGWPGALALLSAIGLSYQMVPPLFAAAAICCFGQMMKEHADSRTALLAALAMGVSPFFLFNAASFYAHTFALFLGICFAWAASRGLRDGDGLYCLLAGASLGLLLTTRLSTAAFISLPLAAAVAFRLIRAPRQTCGPALLMAAGCLPFLCGLAYYQFLITGDPLRPVYWAGGREVDRLYFDPASLVEGARLAFASAVELGEWVSPLLLPAYGLALFMKLKRREATFIDFIFLSVAICGMTYPLDPGNRYGPRYWLEALPFLFYTIATGLHGLTSPVRPVHLAVIGPAFALAALPLQIIEQSARVEDRQSFFREIEAQRLSNAVVLVNGASGRRFQMEALDLIRNDIHLRSTVLYVSGEVAESEVEERYPDREIWVYEGEPARLRRARSLAEMELP